MKNRALGWQKGDGDYVIFCIHENVLPLIFSERTHTRTYVDYEGAVFHHVRTMNISQIK
jgi:hypothetical protein